MLYHQIDASMRKLCFLWPLLSNISRYNFVLGKNSELPFQPLCTVSFDWFLSGWEWILNLEFCLLKLLIFYQKLIWDLGLTLPHFESFKGQLISKANCQAVNSSKKRTNEFVFTSMRRVFFHFLEAFWNHLAFWLSLHVFDQNLHFCAKSFNFDRTYLNTG